MLHFSHDQNSKNKGRINAVYSLFGNTSSKNLYPIETSQLICLANQLTGVYMIQVFIEKYSQR